MRNIRQTLLLPPGTPGAPAAESPGRPGPGVGPSPEATVLLQALAAAVVARRLATPALLFLETGRPLSFVGSQALLFAEPMIRAFFPAPRYREVARLLEDRANIDVLMDLIERGDEERRTRERARRRSCADVREGGRDDS